MQVCRIVLNNDYKKYLCMSVHRTGFLKCVELYEFIQIRTWIWHVCVKIVNVKYWSSPDLSTHIDTIYQKVVETKKNRRRKQQIKIFITKIWSIGPLKSYLFKCDSRRRQLDVMFLIRNLNNIAEMTKDAFTYQYLNLQTKIVTKMSKLTAKMWRQRLFVNSL